MRSLLLGLVLMMSFSVIGYRASAQAEELEQLALDIQKLSQYKQILTDMKKGYQILTAGYGTVRDISKGHFQLSQAFLNALLQISPAVQQYKRIAEIVKMESEMVSEYKSAMSSYQAQGHFSSTELEYIADVYTNLIGESINNVEDLTSLLTANKLRMSDDERISGIDKIYFDMEDKMVFLRSFDNNNSILALQRSRELQGVSTLQIFSNSR